jgi:hypothetical protein
MVADILATGDSVLVADAEVAEVSRSVGNQDVRKSQTNERPSDTAMASFR